MDQLTKLSESASVPFDWVRRHPQAAVILPLLLGISIRLAGISSRPVWYDEAFAILFSEKGVGAMIYGTLAPAGAGASDVHPLGYYTLLWAWIQGFGESLIAVRALSVIASLATIAIIYYLALGMFGPRSALAAGAILALSPFQVHYGQEIRMYAFLGLWLAIATYCYWRGDRDPRWQWWMGFAVSSALAQYTHNLASVYLLCIALWPLLTRNWAQLKRTLLFGVVALLLYLPWLIHLPAQFTKVSQAYWVQRPEPYRLLTLLLAFVVNLPVPAPQLGLGLFVALSVTVVALAHTIVAVRTQDPQWKPAAMLLYMAFAPPFLAFAFSQWKPVYLERAFLPSGIAFCAWLGWTLSLGSMRRTVRAVTILCLWIGAAIGIHEHFAYSGFPYAPFARMADALHQNEMPGDIIVHSSKLSLLPTVYFDRGLEQRYVADPPGSSVDTLAPSTQQVLKLIASSDISAAVGNANRVWFAIFDESNKEYQRAGYEQHPHLVWLENHYTRAGADHWGDLTVYLFVRTNLARSEAQAP